MLSGGVLDEVGGVLDEVDVEVGDQSNSTVALAGTAHLLSDHDCCDELSSMSLEHRKNQGRFKNVKHEAGFLKSGHAWAY